MLIDDIVLKRFWQKVNINEVDSCWIWIAARNRQGYGEFFVNGKLMRAHRVSWMIMRGNIPSGLFCCHHCDNPPCVNPKHLFLGTQNDNMVDAIKKERNNLSGIIGRKGEKNRQAKLTERDVLLIRDLYKNADYTKYKLSNIFSVSTQQIHWIVTNRRWTHI